MARLVTVYKQKYDGYESRRFQAELVESPVAGWLATFSDRTKNASFKNGRPVDSVLGGETSYRYIVYLLSKTTMMTASFYYSANGQMQAAQCDIAMPASMEGDAIRFVDLELDLIIRADGSHYLRDFHEFAEHRVRMGYSDEMVSGARSALLEALRLFRGGAFPFDGSAQRVLLRELALRGKTPR